MGSRRQFEKTTRSNDAHDVGCSGWSFNSCHDEPYLGCENKVSAIIYLDFWTRSSGRYLCRYLIEIILCNYEIPSLRVCVGVDSAPNLTLQPL